MTWGTKLRGGKVVGHEPTRKLATEHRNRTIGFWIGPIVKVKKKKKRKAKK